MACQRPPTLHFCLEAVSRQVPGLGGGRACPSLLRARKPLGQAHEPGALPTPLGTSPRTPPPWHLWEGHQDGMWAARPAVRCPPRASAGACPQQRWCSAGHWLLSRSNIPGKRKLGNVEKPAISSPQTAQPSHFVPCLLHPPAQRVPGMGSSECHHSEWVGLRSVHSWGLAFYNKSSTGFLFVF